MPCEFKFHRRVEFSETDLAGIMHFSNYFRFMESAEGAFFRSLGFSVVLTRNGLPLGLPRVHATCDYMAPLRFEDEVLVHLLVEKKGSRSLTYQFRFYRVNGPAPQQVAIGRITVACVALGQDGAMKAVAIPKILADKIQVAPAELLDNRFAPVEAIEPQIPSYPRRAEDSAALPQPPPPRRAEGPSRTGQALPYLNPKPIA